MRYRFKAERFINQRLWCTSREWEPLYKDWLVMIIGQLSQAMKRTVSIPVNLPSERFLSLMSRCAEIFNAHIDWALANKTYNKNKAHKQLYHLLRLHYPCVPSALVQTIRDNALEAIKATKFKRVPRKKPTSALRYDKRTMTLRGHQLTLSCIGKRVSLILDVPDYFKEVFETWDFCAATITYSKPSKQFWVRLVFETDDPPKQDEDLSGIRNQRKNKKVGAVVDSSFLQLPEPF